MLIDSRLVGETNVLINKVYFHNMLKILLKYEMCYLYTIILYTLVFGM
jgi:hypothetical protein